jgi:AcrR family transcriptional regulator
MKREKVTSRKVLQGRETADRLLQIAKQIFLKQGFAATRTDDIIAGAGVTKGALYHHFSSKEQLFEAVYRSVEDDVANRIESACAGVSDPWEQLLAGCFAYLEACQDEGLQRILRLDGPAVLGLAKWAAIDREYGLDRLLPTLQRMSDSGVIKVPSIEAFARQLTGAMNESTFWIAQHRNSKVALDESKRMLTLMLHGVRIV